MSLKTLKQPSSEIKNPNVEMHQQISVETVCQKYKVWLVHAVPDGYTVDTSLNVDPLGFEQVLNMTLSVQIPNLACSTVEEGDMYNRFQHRFCGVVVIGGSIVYADKNDGMTWAKRDFDEIEDGQILTLVSKIEEAITQKSAINEIHIDTRNGVSVPYIDMDLITELFLYRDPNRNDVYNTINRFKQYITQNKIPFVGLIKGRLVKLDLNEFTSILRSEPNTLWGNHEIPDLSDSLNNYLNNLKKYSFQQVKALAKKLQVQHIEHIS